MSQDRRVRVAIVGAGIVGLTFAIALNEFDRDHKFAIDIYEATPELSEIGAGINVWPRTWEILKQFGLEDTLTPCFDHAPDLEPRIIFGVRKGDQKDGFKVHDIIGNGGALRIHRADFQRSLLKHLPLPGTAATKMNSLCAVHLSHRLINYSYTNAGPITLNFEGKPSTTCDILIGADGIKSSLRPMFLNRLPNPQRYDKFREPVWSGTVAYRGLVSREDLEKVYPGHRILDHPGLMYTGKSRYTVMYPVSGGNFINVVAIVHDTSKDTTVWKGPWKTDVTQAEFFEQYTGWDEEVQALIRCVKQPTKWALQSLNHLDVFAKGRVFLMGDSAHAMLPHLGAGASVGIEDAYILASLLTHHSTPRVLSTHYINHLASVYNTIRVPRAISMAKSTIDTGYLCNLEAPIYEGYKPGDEIPMDLLVEGARTIERNWSWTTTNASEDRWRAEELLGRGGEMAML
ncbi:4-aminobenzoate hydroxylase [Macrolepiota fuliginosa MF-IS2]|uniref:4-aminobenzoate hydroxylase n=1 Tax=Macrolepiota fuliginosa MF-IS2 TaxID=1400762 RepID=A0A9P6C240_9AGAR|nr:4-aminobenzoate hydroxylase [Macrolepiota fuliginosa MF-IS2]